MATTRPATLTAANSLEVSASTTSYTVRGVVNNADYSVWVRAKSATGEYSEDGWSNTVEVRPRLSQEQPANPVVTVTPTDDGELRITWTEAQWATFYNVRIGTSNDVANSAFFGQNLTVLTYTTNNLSGAGAAVGTTYYVWVEAGNGGTEIGRNQQPVSGQIISVPVDAAAFVTTTWKNGGGATYTFSVNNGVIYKNMNNVSEGEGTYAYNAPNLDLIITPTGVNPPQEWTQGTTVTVRGKTFTVNNVSFIRQ
jgi:hypothetical protein